MGEVTIFDDKLKIDNKTNDRMLSDIGDMMNELDSLENRLGSQKQAVREDVNKIKKTDLSSPVEKRVSSDRSDKIKSTEIRAINNRLDDIEARLDMLDELDEQIQAMKATVEEKMDVDFKAMYSNTLEQMNIEAIKIYRDVQAVIVEETSKQNSALFGIDGKSDNLKKRMNHLMIFSTVSFVVSILVMLMLILPALGFNILG